MTDILNIKDDQIASSRLKFTYTIHLPTQRVQWRDKNIYTRESVYTDVWKIFIFESKQTKNKVVQDAHVVLRNNYVAFIFDEIRYELNGVEIDVTWA